MIERHSFIRLLLSCCAHLAHHIYRSRSRDSQPMADVAASPSTRRKKRGSGSSGSSSSSLDSPSISSRKKRSSVRLADGTSDATSSDASTSTSTSVSRGRSNTISAPSSTAEQPSPTAPTKADGSSSQDADAVRRFSITGADSDVIRREVEHAQQLAIKSAASASTSSLASLKRMMGKSTIEVGFVIEFTRISNLPPAEGTRAMVRERGALSC